MIEIAVQEFAHLLGLPSLELREGEVIQLTIEKMGELTLLYRAPRVLIAMTQVFEERFYINAQRLLTQCHYREEQAFPLYALRKGNKIGYAIVLQEADVSAVTLSEAVDTLWAALEKQDPTRTYA